MQFVEDYYVQSKVRNNHHSRLAGEIYEGGGLGGRTWEKKDGESLPLQGVFYLERNMVVVMMMTMAIVLMIYIYYDEVCVCVYVCHEKSSLPTSELSAGGAK